MKEHGVGAPRAFISHSSKDKNAFVLGFARRLREAAVDAWVDLWEMLPGDSLTGKIFEEGLGEADAVIAVVSKGPGAKVTMVSGMTLLAIGMALLTRISSEGGYLGVLLPGFVFTGLGLGFTFVTATIAGTSGVADGEQGLASGLINTAQQVGTALGLAVLVTVAAARTGALSGGAAPSAGDLIEGYRMAFLFGGGLAALGACIALFVVRRDECEEAASKLEDREDAAAFLAECRQASRM